MYENILSKHQYYTILMAPQACNYKKMQLSLK